MIGQISCQSNSLQRVNLLSHEATGEELSIAVKWCYWLGLHSLYAKPHFSDGHKVITKYLLREFGHTLIHPGTKHLTVLCEPLNHSLKWFFKECNLYWYECICVFELSWINDSVQDIPSITFTENTVNLFIQELL